MSEHHVDIYHCQKCGRLSSCDHEDCAPECCSEEMSRAVANITYTDDQSEIGTPDEVIEKSHCSAPPVPN